VHSQGLNLAGWIITHASKIFGRGNCMPVVDSVAEQRKLMRLDLHKEGQGGHFVVVTVIQECNA
jgi:hypothetical protein